MTLVAQKEKRFKRFIVTLVFGAAAGLGLGTLVKDIVAPSDGPAVAGLASGQAGFGAQPEATLESDEAWRYVAAIQANNGAAVVARTLWMQDRLRRVLAEEGSQEAVAAERDKLGKRVTDRNFKSNHLRVSGVEDWYVFAPGATVEVVQKDSGAEGLAAPVASRTWFRVTYAERSAALCDTTGIPIRSLIAGVNISEKGLVLKAGIIGNLEIVRDSIQYDW